MNIFKKKSNERAATVIEYSLIGIAVMLGIILMAPTVANMVNAYFKGMETSVQESYYDPLTPGNSDDPSLPGGCSCSWVLPPPCTTAPCCGVGTCAPDQHSLVKICDPALCEPMEYQCVDEPACCTTSGPLGCGDGGCALNQMHYTKTCGNPASPTITEVCVDGDASCEFGCTDEYSGADYCKNFPQDADDETGLTANTHYTLVNTCTAAQKCEQRCKAGHALEYLGPGPYDWQCTKLFINVPELGLTLGQGQCGDEVSITCPGGYMIVGGGINTAGDGDDDGVVDVPDENYVANSCNGSNENIRHFVNEPGPIETDNNPPSVHEWRFQANNYKVTGYARCGRLDLIPENTQIVSRVSDPSDSQCDNLLTVMCADGETVVGGGMYVESNVACPGSNNDNNKIFWLVSRPFGGEEGWQCGVDGRGGPGNVVRCYAECLQIPDFIP
jgi:Flp pilus assembly pilin Flp